VPYPKIPLHERLARGIDRSGGDDSCWPWTRMTSRNGYGLLVESHHGRRVLAHRLSYEIHSGAPIPGGLFVCHRCDNPPCCNPAHLFLGTQSDNAHDMWNKRRGYVRGPGSRAAKGSRVGGAKLRESDVPEIRAARQSGLRLKEIASRHGVSEATVSMIVNGKTWRHV